MISHWPRNWFIANMWGLLGLCAAGCATVPQPVPAAAGVVEPMTLPRYLGVTTVWRSAHTSLVRSRVCLGRYLPVIAPQAVAPPMSLGDPAALQSPAPAVAAAASVQQAEASAPGKIAALSYLGSVDCSQHPQVEEALLASLCDPIDSVRIAAIEAILSGQQRCGHNKQCNQCGPSCGGGCCTPAIHARLLAMASEQTATGCWCEPNPTARRLARLALSLCYPATVAPPSQPQELPPAEVLEMMSVTP